MTGRRRSKQQEEEKVQRRVRVRKRQTEVWRLTKREHSTHRETNKVAFMRGGGS